MSPRTEEQFEEIRESKKLLIMETALELFATDGYHSTSISKIATAAKISKGLMYNYFDSKEDLMRQIIDEGIDEMMAAFDPNKDGVLTQEEYVYLIETLFEILKNKTKFWRLLMALFMQPDVMKIFEEKLISLLPTLLKTMMTFFEAKGYEDPQNEAVFFGSILDGIAFDYVFAPDIYPIDNIKRRLIKMYT